MKVARWESVFLEEKKLRKGGIPGRKEYNPTRGPNKSKLGGTRAIPFKGGETSL